MILGNPVEEGCEGCSECEDEESEYAQSVRFTDAYQWSHPAPEEEEEDTEEERGEPEWHTELTDDHDNFEFVVSDSTQVTRSEDAAKALWNTCKESRRRVRALWHRKGRGTRLFNSFTLNKLRLSPTHDIFLLDSIVWAPVYEWHVEQLAASKDVLRMQNFQIDFDTFKRLVEPAKYTKNTELLEVSYSACGDRFRLPGSSELAETSLTAVFKNAKQIFVIPAAVPIPTDLSDWEPLGPMDTGRGFEMATVPECMVMKMLWDGRSKEFNALCSPEVKKTKKKDSKGKEPEVNHHDDQQPHNEQSKDKTTDNNGPKDKDSKGKDTKGGDSKGQDTEDTEQPNTKQPSDIVDWFAPELVIYEEAQESEEEEF